MSASIQAPSELIARWLAIVGIGEDGIAGISPAAGALISGAAVVYGGARHIELAADLIRGETKSWPSPMRDAVPEIIGRRGERVAVLASGDPYMFGVGSVLARSIPADEIVAVPAPSSFSLACARLGWSLADVATITCCGRPIDTLAPHLQPDRRLIVLSADETTPAAIAAYLSERGFGGSSVHVMEALGGPLERVRETTAKDFGFKDIGALNLLAIEVEASPDAFVMPLTSGLPDEFYENDGQFTKREIRAVTLSALAPRVGERLWDIGCGSGSISIEWLLRHPANRAVAIERGPDRAARAARNAANLGVPRLEIVQSAAPDAFAGLPAPDVVFVGGGGTSDGIIEGAWKALRSGGRMVVNSVTLETEARLIEAQRTLGGTLSRISIERLDTIGGMHGFRPALTVTQWTAEKPLTVAGIGCRKGCNADEIVALIDKAVEQAGIANCKFTALAAPAFKTGEAGLLGAADRLGLPLLWIDEAAMKAAEPRCKTHSDAALEATGFSSVAEAAALAAAGRDANLVQPRIASAMATCALAERERA